MKTKRVGPVGGELDTVSRFDRGGLGRAHGLIAPHRYGPKSVTISHCRGFSWRATLIEFVPDDLGYCLWVAFPRRKRHQSEPMDAMPNESRGFLGLRAAARKAAHVGGFRCGTASRGVCGARCSHQSRQGSIGDGEPSPVPQCRFQFTSLARRRAGLRQRPDYSRR